MDVSRFGNYDTLDINLWVGFDQGNQVSYRQGNTFNHYKEVSGNQRIVCFDETEGVPYTRRFARITIPEAAIRLWEIYIDHFYQNRGIVQIGTIVAKMPTSADVLLQAVKDLTPLRLERQIDYNHTFNHD